MECKVRAAAIIYWVVFVIHNDLQQSSPLLDALRGSLMQEMYDLGRITDDRASKKRSSPHRHALF